MRILMVGVTSIRYVRENWLEPMRKMYDITYVPYDTLIRAMGVEKLNRYIADKCKEGFDYVFFYPDGRGQMFTDELFELLKNERKIVFHSDDAGGLWFKNCSRFDYRYDFVATSAKEGYIKRTKADDYKGNVTYVPWGYNPDIFYKLDNVEKDTDIVFLGSNFERDGEYIHDGEFRQALLTKLYEASLKYGFSLKLYGAGWDRHPVLKNCYMGFAEADKINDMFNRTRIILGLGYTIDKNPTYQTKLKHFENSGTGSFQLVNYNPELEEIFGDSLGYYSDEDDMIRQVLYYLDNPEEREKKAAEAYRICTEECTMSARIDELFMKAGEFFRYKPMPVDSGEQIRIGHIKETEVNDSVKKGEYDYYRLEDGVMCFDWNETAIPREVRSGKDSPEVLAVNSYVSFCDPSELDEGKIIRRTAGPDAVVIPPVFHVEDLAYGDEIIKQFSWVENDGEYYPLSNYLFRSDCIVNRMAEIDQGNVNCLINAPKLDGICGDYIVPDESFVIKRYYEFFDKTVRENKSVVIYGLFGYIYELWNRWICQNGIPDNVIYVDKKLAGKEIDGIECIDLDTLLNLDVKPSVVLITALFSAEEIYHLLEPLEDCTSIIKMYDVNSF